MTQKQKIRKVEKLFREIQKLFPDNFVDLSIHTINMDKLDKKWKVTGHRADGGRRYWVAKRNDESFDITLFN